MSWEQRNADFCNAQTDAQMAYIEAEREVDRLQAENAKLREEFDKMDVWHSKELSAAMAENAKLRELVRKLHDELVSCEENEYIPGGHKFDGDVRELGVEVDG